MLAFHVVTSTIGAVAIMLWNWFFCLSAWRGELVASLVLKGPELGRNIISFVFLHNSAIRNINLKDVE
jgi:hypothetical protein